MAAKRKRIGRQLLRVFTGPEDDVTSYDVTTAPVDDNLAAITGAKHGWPGPDVNPVGYLMFLAWAAGRRTGKIPPTLTYEQFQTSVLEIEILDVEPITPTRPAHGAG